ncbi:ASB10 protein, partial [Certhia familiaris]|nr:ASB10 protein [Certhia familiaris]
VMDCTFPPRSATQRLLQPAQWKNSHSVRSHHSEHSPSQHGWGHQHSRLQPLECRDLLVQNALFTGDLDMVQKYFTKSAAINLIIETRGDVLRWTSRKCGMWQIYWEIMRIGPLEGLLEKHILRTVLLEISGMDVKYTRWGACMGGKASECCSVEMRYGHQVTLAHPHRCVRQLLQHGASVNSQTEEENDTALHVASRHGLAEHVQLLLHHGAELEVKNKEGQTPLNAACAQHHQPQDMGRYYQVCQLLVESGASINAADRDRQHPLHLACKNANAQIAELLLARGASVNVMNYGGNTALHNILQVAAYKLEHHPELVVRALLNHGAVRIWPGSLLKVLRYCHTCPRVIEALVNSYTHVRVSEDWVAAVPAEVVQKYPCFYQSLFSLGHRPRSLQHLARCTLRTLLEGRLLLVLSQLHLPSALHQFLLLGFEDILY